MSTIGRQEIAMKSVSTLGAVVLVAVFPLMAATIPARFPEGVTRGFLVLSGVDGVTVAHGDMFQVVRDGEIDKRMVFRFNDGSLLDEHVTFTQQGVYTLKRYRLSEKGPVFEEDREVSMTPATGAYRMTMKDHKGGEEKTLEGTLDLPADVYNGMIPIVVKNLPKGSSEIVHYVAFTPKPRLIELALTPAGEEKVEVGDLTMKAAHYLIKPKLGVWLKVFATLTGRVPPDLHIWVVTDEVPAFVGFEGTLGTQGQVWRIDTFSPRRPR